MLRVRFVAAALVTLFLMAACASGSGGSSAFSYSGTWSGTMVDSLLGNGTVTMTIAQSGSNIGGTWQATFGDANNSGNLIGVVDSTQLVVELNPSNPNACPYDAVATRSGTTATGTYAAFNCSVSISGTVSVTKQ